MTYQIEEDEDVVPAPTAGKGAWAIVGLGVALCLVLGSSLFDLQRASTTLTGVDRDQTTALAASHKGEDQLNALAKGTQQLADGGNANALAVVLALQRAGVRINANAPPAK